MVGLHGILFHFILVFCPFDLLVFAAFTGLIDYVRQSGLTQSEA